MKLKDSVVISKINDEYVLVDSDCNTTRFNGLIKLNETSKTVVDSLKEEISKEELIKKLLAIYDVDEVKLTKDIDKIIDELSKVNLIV